MKKNNEEKDYKITPIENSNVNDVIEDNDEITDEDFRLINVDKQIHERKFETKPTTFFKDSLKRFAKNKSSVVAAGILGCLLILAVVIPIVSNSDVSSPHNEIRYLEPKLFPAGTGFWDGTRKYTNISTDISLNPNATSEKEKQESWWPNPEGFVKSAVSNKVFSDLTYTNSATANGKEGYVQVGYTNTIDDSEEYSEFFSVQATVPFDLTSINTLDIFDVYDVNKLNLGEGKSDLTAPSNYELGECALYFNYFEGIEPKSIMICDYKSSHNIGSDITSLKEEPIDINAIIKEVNPNLTSINKWNFSVRVKNDKQHNNTCVLIKKILFETTSSNDQFIVQFTAPGFLDATGCMNETAKIKDSEGRNVTNYAYWASNGIKYMYRSKVIYCSFTYDSYAGMLGVKKYTDSFDFPNTYWEKYVENGWFDFDPEDILRYDAANKKYVLRTDGKYANGEYGWVVKGYENVCPIAQTLTKDNIYFDPYEGEVDIVNVDICFYLFYGYSSMPIFLFGTDTSGHDMLKYVFEGLRTSLLLGILTFAVCFIFGLIWGSVSGYYGGTVDLVMERFTDILSGIPWIVVMTLTIIHMGSNFWTFAIALCLTGWIGTAATTRTQFYRFRGREYVLASRTLGASDTRLIFKHILPNALGTIITGAVLMIPSVIFSEATISYLGLGLKNMSSLGVILSDCQGEISAHPYLLIFPSVIIALLMITFNLFGNGLRDAVNPSLKGEDE